MNSEAEKRLQEALVAIMAAALDLGLLVVGFGALWWVFTRSGDHQDHGVLRQVGRYLRRFRRAGSRREGRRGRTRSNLREIRSGSTCASIAGSKIPEDAKCRSDHAFGGCRPLHPADTGRSRAATRWPAVQSFRSSGPRRRSRSTSSYSSIDELASALGPEGANKNGALSEFVETACRRTSTATVKRWETASPSSPRPHGRSTIRVTTSR